MPLRRLTVLIALAAIVPLVGCGPVAYPPNPLALKNAQLAATIKTTLLNATGLDATRIDVRVADGVVTLEGVVPAADDERRAMELVREVPGVTRVESKLKIGRLLSVSPDCSS